MTPAVTDINMYQVENSGPHHTDQFHLVYKKPGATILRRGHPFKVGVTAKGIPPENLRLVFSFGPNPIPFQSTQGVITLGKEETPHKDSYSWTGKLISEDESDRKLFEVTSPAHAPVGQWKVRCDVTSGHEAPTYHHPYDVYLLFNPWCKDDAVYMQEEDLLEEYVLNEYGKIWKEELREGRPWVFGQFDKFVLPASMLLLERTGLHPLSRGDPVKMSRAISKLVNSNDDQGVLRGKWNDPYDGGVSPSAWTGSVPILRKYLETGQEVKYGQCWVFAGVLTTVCRALGLPSRVVSNFFSAHDSNASLTIDSYYDEELQPITRGVPNDSIWNFHVWNDVWMARYDLPPGYGGWQAVDSTPQETSDGFFQCGPASVRAVRSGAIGHPYDAAFLYSSVNADIIRWKEDKNSDLGYVKIQSVKDQVGKLILTKKPFLFDYNGSRDKEDITNEYKAREGSEMERLALMNAVRKNEVSKRYYDIKESHADVHFTLVDLERILMGEDYKIAVQIHNTAKEQRTIKALLSSSSIYYTGIVSQEVKKVGTTFTLEPNTREEFSTTVTSAEYSPKLVEYGIMKINVIATVKETNQTWADEDDFQVIKPAVNIEMKGQLQVGKECQVELAVLNPTAAPITKGYFYYECPGLVKSRKAKIKEIQPREVGRTSVSFVAKRAGKFRLVVVFSSKQLTDMTGTREINIA